MNELGLQDIDIQALREAAKSATMSQTIEDMDSLQELFEPNSNLFGQNAVAAANLIDEVEPEPSDEIKDEETDKGSTSSIFREKEDNIFSDGDDENSFFQSTATSRTSTVDSFKVIRWYYPEGESGSSSSGPAIRSILNTLLENQAIAGFDPDSKFVDIKLLDPPTSRSSSSVGKTKISTRPSHIPSASMSVTDWVNSLDETLTIESTNESGVIVQQPTGFKFAPSSVPKDPPIPPPHPRETGAIPKKSKQPKKEKTTPQATSTPVSAPRSYTYTNTLGMQVKVSIASYCKKCPPSCYSNRKVWLAHLIKTHPNNLTKGLFL